jgi:SAM-dependent methyltransferase
VRRSLRAAGFHRGLIEANVSGLLRLVRRLSADPPASLWAKYEQTWTYKAEDVAAKEAFVEQSLRGRRWKQVWDLGCNTGRYALLAARHADFVLAIDGDPLAVELLYQRLRGTGPANVLPLTMDLSDSSPAQGWRGRERLPLAGRGKPDAVLCLALLHHLVLSANLPLDEVVAWLGGLTDHLVIEFPTRDDPMVRALLDGRDEPADDYDRARFEACLARSFPSVSRQLLPSGTRILYRAERGR